MYPKARKDNLLIQEVAGELVIYDEMRHRVHNLNDTAARVWKMCDGVRSESDIARCLAEETNIPVDEAVIRLTLIDLGRARLLEAQTIAAEPATAAMSRRQFMRQAAMAAGLTLALPIVTSMIAPTPAYAWADDPPPRDTCTGTHKVNKPATITTFGETKDDAEQNAREEAQLIFDKKCTGACPKGKCKSAIGTFVLQVDPPEKPGVFFHAHLIVITYTCGCV